VRRLAQVVGAVEALVLAVSALVGVYLLARGGQGPVLGGIAIWFLLAVTSAVGWLLASRLPHHPLGWLLLVVAGLFLTALVAFAVGTAVADARPGLASWLFWYASNGEVTWSWLPPVGLLFTQVLLRFPDGDLPTPRWRWFSWFTLASIAGCSVLLATTPGGVGSGLDNPVAWAWGKDHATALLPVMAASLLVSFVGSAASVVVRYRRGDPTTRTQIRWVAWAGSVVIGLYVLSFLVPGSVLDNWVVLAYTLIPASIGVAVLRYRLYDIDRVFSRTTSYAIVTGILLATYAIVVTLVSQFVPHASSVAVVVATLSAAALASPVLRRVQVTVDRRFNRARYDAIQTVDAFGAQLRHQVDPDRVRSDLAAVVAVTLQPDQVTVWMQPRT